MLDYWWLAFCLMIGRPAFFWRLIKSMAQLSNLVVEYVGGPEDGRKTSVVLKDNKTPIDDYLDTYSDDLKTVHRYKRTDRKTKEGTLVYVYSGWKKAVCKN